MRWFFILGNRKQSKFDVVGILFTKIIITQSDLCESAPYAAAASSVAPTVSTCPHDTRSHVSQGLHVRVRMVGMNKTDTEQLDNTLRPPFVYWLTHSYNWFLSCRKERKERRKKREERREEREKREREKREERREKREERREKREEREREERREKRERETREREFVLSLDWPCYGSICHGLVCT